VIRINIKFFSFIKFETGLEEIQSDIADGGTVMDLIQKLDEEHGESLTRFIKHKTRDKVISLFVRNNKILKLDDPLYDNDEIKIMPAVGGG